jgi:hypothetical protein
VKRSSGMGPVGGRSLQQRTCSGSSVGAGSRRNHSIGWFQKPGQRGSHSPGALGHLYLTSGMRRRSVEPYSPRATMRQGSSVFSFKW